LEYHHLLINGETFCPAIYHILCKPTILLKYLIQESLIKQNTGFRRTCGQVAVFLWMEVMLAVRSRIYISRILIKGQETQMKLIFIGLLSAIALVSGSCVTPVARPEWYAGDSKKYDKADYLLGRGLAGTLEEAKNRARADLAQIFQVAIAVESEDVQKYKNNPATASGGQYAVDSTRRITTRTEQIISGIQIAETWQDTASREFYVLAILPRLQAGESLGQQLKQLDETIQSNIDQSKSSADLLFRIAAANNAVSSQFEREGLQRALQVVDVTGRGIESRYNSAKLRLDLNELLKHVRIVSRILDGSAPGLEEVVSGALTHAGFTLDTVEPMFMLKAGLKLADVGIIDGWYWQRGNLEVSVSETASGRVRGAQRWPIKSSGRDRATAIRRSLDEANDVLRKELGATIMGMANGQ
jgi:hypothetical protein